MVNPRYSSSRRTAGRLTVRSLHAAAANHEINQTIQATWITESGVGNDAILYRFRSGRALRHEFDLAEGAVHLLIRAGGEIENVS